MLHNTGRDLPGVPVYLQPDSQTPCHPLLPPTTGNRPVTCHELLCACHQGKDRVMDLWNKYEVWGAAVMGGVAAKGVTSKDLESH